MAAVVVLGAGLAGGAASAATGMIDGTGPDSTQVVSSNTEATHEFNNDVEASFTNNNPQTALSGDATADDSNTAGGAMSGAANNGSTTGANLTVDQSGAASAVGGSGASSESTNEGTISNTGPNSDSTVTSTSKHTVTVNNNANLSVTNNNTQEAVSGVAVVSGNTEGGNATSGSAANTSNTTFTLNVTQ